MDLAAHLRDQLTKTFEPELDALEVTAAADTLELLDLHSRWETRERLRSWQDLPADRAKHLVAGLLARTLAA